LTFSIQFENDSVQAASVTTPAVPKDADEETVAAFLLSQEDVDEPKGNRSNPSSMNPTGALEPVHREEPRKPTRPKPKPALPESPDTAAIALRLLRKQSKPVG
jgi:hypothetical protein